MSYVSTNDQGFLATLASWFQRRPEVLVLTRYSHSAGGKDFRLFTSFQGLCEWLRGLPCRACVTAFKEPQLPLRGIVDDEFITRCLASIPDGEEYVITETQERVCGRVSWLHHLASDSHVDLREELEERRGVYVVAGIYPPWLVDNDEVISAVVPNERGIVECGVY